ncbi:hypothetical protein NNO_1204 [Hydrogenimonas sp.]|nr:hypothetical protein NNO_1204 [Hydrogenimonas sp.]
MKLKFRGLPFLGIVVLIYVTLFLFHSQKTFLALEKSFGVMIEILPIFLIVILFTALINYYFKSEDVAAHLGKESGFKGWVIALTAGIISHGPMYAWYPMLEDLKKHGLKNGLIATFFYARSIKVPLLPIMIDYFGLAFTLFLSLYILIASVIQGFLIDWLCAKSNHCD